MDDLHEVLDRTDHAAEPAPREEIARLRAIIEQMLEETGNGGNTKCGDNRLTPGTIKLSRSYLGWEPEDQMASEERNEYYHSRLRNLF